MDLMWRLQQLVEQLPDDAIGGMSDDVKIMIVKKFWGEAKWIISPRVKKILQLIEWLDDMEKKQLMENCALNHKD